MKLLTGLMFENYSQLMHIARRIQSSWSQKTIRIEMLVPLLLLPYSLVTVYWWQMLGTLELSFVEGVMVSLKEVLISRTFSLIFFLNFECDQYFLVFTKTVICLDHSNKMCILIRFFRLTFRVGWSSFYTSNIPLSPVPFQMNKRFWQNLALRYKYIYRITACCLGRITAMNYSQDAIKYLNPKGKSTWSSSN